MSKILVLPGTKWQIPLIRKIKEIGHEAFVVNPVKNPEIYELAEGFLASDIFSIDEIEKYAQKNRIEGILSDECDIAMPVIAELGRRLHLPALSEETAALYTNKYTMREFCRENGFRTPEYRLCKKTENAIEFLHDLHSPIIIKPIDSNASHGVFKAETEKDIQEHFEEAMFFSRMQKAVLAERFIAGTEFTMDGIKTPEHHYTLAISEKEHYSHNSNIAKELLFTHRSKRYDYEKLKEINNQFIMHSSLLFGLTHAEYKYENGEYYLIEIGARGGGNMISSIIAPFMAGHDTYEYLIRCALGDITSPKFDIPASHQNKAAVLKFFDLPLPGEIVRNIMGLNYLKTEPDIKDYMLNFSIGDRIKNARNDSERIGYYIACSENRDKLEAVMKQVEKQVRIMMQ